MGKVSLITAAIGLFIALLLGHLPLPKIKDADPIIDNDKSVIWSIVGYGLLILGLGGAVFYYIV